MRTQFVAVFNAHQAYKYAGQVFIDSFCSNMPLLSLRYLQFQ